MYLWLFVVGRGVQVARVMSGSFMTSLEMAGMSLSLMRVDKEILRLFGELILSKAVFNIGDHTDQCISIFEEGFALLHLTQRYHVSTPCVILVWSGFVSVSYISLIDHT